VPKKTCEERKVPQALAPSAAESARPGDACEQGEPVQSVSPCASCAESRVEVGVCCL
jgi:hypothetical protein